MALNSKTNKTKKQQKDQYDLEFIEQIKDVNPAAENLDIGEEELPPLEVNVPSLILDVRKVSIGYSVDTAIFADIVYNQSFIYKNGTAAISQLRRFARMFKSFNGNLASIVGKCALINIKQTSYGMLYMSGVCEITRTEANRMFEEVKKSFLEYEDLEDGYCIDENDSE